MPLLELQRIAWVKLTLAVLAGYGAYKGLPQFADIRLTATTLVALSGTLTGFIMTALSMLVATADRPFMLNLRKTGHYQTLMRDGLRAAALWVAVVVVALFGHFLTGAAQILAVSAATGLLSFALLYFLGAGRKFGRIMETLTRL